MNSALLEKLPFVFLFKKGIDGHIVNGTVHPKVRGFSSSHPSKFQLIPLKEDGSIIVPNEKIQTRSEFFKLLRTGWKHVAIRSEDGKYISCRRKTVIPLLGFEALAEYRSHIGEFERFKLQYHHGTGCVSFHSHNSLLLSGNKKGKFWTVAFRPEPEKFTESVASHMSWSISPLLSRVSDDERVEFVGVLDVSFNEFVMELQAEGGGLSEVYLEKVKDLFLSSLDPGNCTHFEGSNGLWHYCARNNEKNGTAYIVIVTGQFPRALAGACVEDLSDIHEKYVEGKRDEDLKKYKLNKAETIRKELQFLIWEYDEMNQNMDLIDLKPVIARMEENIGAILGNLGNLEHIAEESEALMKETEQFKKLTKSAKKRYAKKWVLINSGIAGAVGGGLGALVGWLIGGPVAAAYFAGQSVEIAVFALGGLGLGAAVGSIASSSVVMWKKYKPIHTII